MNAVAINTLNAGIPHLQGLPIMQAVGEAPSAALKDYNKISSLSSR